MTIISTYGVFFRFKGIFNIFTLRAIQLSGQLTKLNKKAFCIKREFNFD